MGAGGRHGKAAASGANRRSLPAACPLHPPLFASLGGRSPSRHFVGEVGRLATLIGSAEGPFSGRASTRGATLKLSRQPLVGRSLNPPLDGNDRTSSSFVLIIPSTSPTKWREGDRPPSEAKSGGWRGQARGRALRHRTLIANRARALRKAMSEPEVMLWSRLRGRAPDRPTFRRQHPIGSVILDFYCPSVRLAVEVDGATHWDDERRERDDARDAWLAGEGVTVMRIPASAVYRDLARVTDAILLRVDELRTAERSCPRPAPSTSRHFVGEVGRLPGRSATAPRPSAAAAGRPRRRRLPA